MFGYNIPSANPNGMAVSSATRLRMRYGGGWCALCSGCSRLATTVLGLQLSKWAPEGAALGAHLPSSTIREQSSFARGSPSIS